ncbi:hypothetical protein FC56_GL000911 [Lentilactobacillus senioris DSM 24302 = JCM 17472]|uniref:Uncharacterized protein n=1 Tax=Lentilactobacillus senioris DSM 24302 = JCM 17472 TaxID=1423802 RepID=A0A0R2CNN1_9LACO|nr:hypothetical protein [Lentilactobacillus senioris]KRM93246.1 hypothetical protein FC56_GL000911 [Lentilactobacillus senioris DSM 24302 = JCM 17472]
MNQSDRFFQPQNSKDAMRQIEKLFNQYKDAPLTSELITYHRSLMSRLQTDILAAAKQEGIPDRLAANQSMIDIMNHWLTIRLSGQPYNGKMKSFKFVADNATPKFKRRVLKSKGASNHRSARH